MARAVVRIHARVLASILSSLLFMQVGPCRPPAHVPTPQEASHPSLLLLAASRRQQCSSLVARVRGGGGGADATPPLVAATGFDAQADDETEELVVDSPGNDVLAPASGRAATPFRDRGARTEVLFPGRSLAPGSGMPVPLGKVPHMPFAPGLAHRAVPVSGAQPMGSRLQRQVRPDTPASSRYGSARELEQSGSARPETASKSMETRIAELEAALSDRSSDWSQRLSALKGLLVVMSSLSDTISKDASGADHRTGVLLRIVPGLCSQLQDKRSSLVKEVCHTINGIARLLGSAFEPVAPKLVPALLSLTFVTVRVMSTSAWESLHVISERVRPTILLPELEKGLADSHVPLRQCCASLLAQMLAQRSAVELDPHVASVVDMTVLALNDPGVGVRNKGKEAFTHIAKLFPAQAKQMMLRVSGAMRIQLSKQFADEVPFLAQDSEASESTAVEAGSIVEMLAGSRMLAGKMSGRSRFDEFRAFRRQQQRERKDDQEDVVVFSPMNNPHTETASDSRPQPSRTDRDLLSVPPLRVQVEETGNTRRVSVEPHAGTSRRARGHRGRAAAEETVAWEQRRQAPVSPRVRVRFRDDVIPAPPVDENESDEPALDAGEYRESQQGSCITLEDGDSDEGENESKEADHSECATLLNGQTADDSSSSEGRYTFDSNGDSNRDELHAAVHAEDTRCAKPECSAIAHDQPGGAQEPHFRQQSLGKNTGKKPPRYGVYSGQGWTEVTVGKAAHAATPRKAFVGVRTAMSRKPPVRMPTGVHATANTVKGRGVPTPRGRNAPANMCAIRAHTTSAGALPRPPHAMRENALQAAHRPETEVRHSVWKAGVQAQSRRCTQSARASQGSAATKVVGDGRGIRLERLFQDCDAFLRNRNISGSSAALPAGISSTEATTEQLQHASGAPGEAVANSSMVYQECDMLKRQLSLSHSLTGMLWMTMRCAETLRGVGRGVVQDPRAPVPPVGSGSEVKFASDSLAVDVSSSTMSSQLSQCAVAHSALPTSSSARSQPNLHQLAVSQATTASSSHSSEDSSVDYSSTESSRDSSMASAGAEEPETEEGIADARPSTETRIKETVRQDGQPCVDSVVTESSGDLMPEKDGADSESAPPMKASEPTRTKMESEDTGEDKDGTSEEEEEEEEEEDEADNDYEAERQARIRQNMDAMAQLGLERKPAPEPQARALARGRAPAESLGSEDSTPSEWECKGEESSQWETEQTELSEDEGDCRRGRGTDGMLRGERRRTWDWQDHLNKMHEQGKSDKSNLKISLFAPDAQFVGGGKGAGPGILKQKQKLPSLKMHPSRVDPQEKGLTRLEQFRAEMVCAVYESEGTSAAEELMGSSLPSIIHRAFAEVGWGAECAEVSQKETGGVEATHASSMIAPNKALSVHDLDDSEMEQESQVHTSSGSPINGQEGQGVGGGHALTHLQKQDSASVSASPSSSSGSSLGKRMRECTMDETNAKGAKGAKGKLRGRERGNGRAPQGRKSRDDPAPLAEGEWCRRDGVKGKYYQIRHKYVCNNCGHSGHVKSTCRAPLHTMDKALEAQGWQVIVVARKGGRSEEKFFVPPCKSIQLRGIRKLQEYAETELQMTLSDLLFADSSAGSTDPSLSAASVSHSSPSKHDAGAEDSGAGVVLTRNAGGRPVRTIRLPPKSALLKAQSGSEEAIHDGLRKGGGGRESVLSASSVISSVSPSPLSSPVAAGTRS